MKTEVYSWRLSGELKGLQKSRVEAVEGEVQRQLHAEAAGCLGVLRGRNPNRVEMARQTIRQRLVRRRCR